MNRIPIIAISFLLSSCEDRWLNDYENLIDLADRIVVSDRSRPDSIVISSAPFPGNMQEILKRDVQPESPCKFIADRPIVLYSAHKRIGILLISNGEKPYVNSVHRA